MSGPTVFADEDVACLHRRSLNVVNDDDDGDFHVEFSSARGRRSVCFKCLGKHFSHLVGTWVVSHLHRRKETWGPRKWTGVRPLGKPRPKRVRVEKKTEFHKNTKYLL